MVKGLRHAALALIPRINQQAVVSNNLANLNTTAFKKDRLFVELLRVPEDSTAPDDHGFALSERMVTDFGQGSLRQTGAPLDLALSGEGFFVVRTASGEALTRGASFHLTEQGQIVNSLGEPLLGSGGAITIPLGTTTLTIGADGTVSADTKAVDRVRVVSVEDTNRLEKIEAGRYRLDQGLPAPASDFEVRQGFLESSNATGIEEMTTMMALFREYEAAQRAMKIQGESVGTAVNRVGRTA
ncbi:MAG: flagellar biosynthesis protein FlgF [Gemmatimonadetes bacterium]|nr:flagellar biosynthesis protein FlgF [Gemmatimonadota bacterium]